MEIGSSLGQATPVKRQRASGIGHQAPVSQQQTAQQSTLGQHSGSVGHSPAAAQNSGHIIMNVFVLLNWTWNGKRGIAWHGMAGFQLLTTHGHTIQVLANEWALWRHAYILRAAIMGKCGKCFCATRIQTHKHTYLCIHRSVYVAYKMATGLHYKLPLGKWTFHTLRNVAGVGGEWLAVGFVSLLSFTSYKPWIPKASMLQ